MVKYVLPFLSNCRYVLGIGILGAITSTPENRMILLFYKLILILSEEQWVWYVFITDWSQVVSLPLVENFQVCISINQFIINFILLFLNF